MTEFSPPSPILLPSAEQLVIKNEVVQCIQLIFDLWGRIVGGELLGKPQDLHPGGFFDTLFSQSNIEILLMSFRNQITAGFAEHRQFQRHTPIPFLMFTNIRASIIEAYPDFIGGMQKQSSLYKIPSYLLPVELYEGDVDTLSDLSFRSRIFEIAHQGFPIALDDITSASDLLSRIKLIGGVLRLTPHHHIAKIDGAPIDGLTTGNTDNLQEILEISNKTPWISTVVVERIETVESLHLLQLLSSMYKNLHILIQGNLFHEKQPLSKIHFLQRPKNQIIV